MCQAGSRVRYRGVMPAVMNELWLYWLADMMTLRRKLGV
jgi:hypothetical protein